MVNCRECGKRSYGGTEARKQAQLCYDCWRSTVECRLKESGRRKKNFSGKRSICDLTPGRRVRKVKVELFNNRTPPEEGTIVSAPVLTGGNCWRVEVHWDGRPSPQSIDVRRVSLCPLADPSGALTPASPTRP
jgi:hypothetical protein